LAVELLRNNVYGFYYKIGENDRAFYTESIFWDKGSPENLFKILSNISYYSPISGYPGPLFFAHHLGKLNRKYADGILDIVQGIITKRIGKDYELLLDGQFRRLL
jgi:hypothetical protein